MEYSNIKILVFLPFLLIGLISDIEGQNKSKKESIVKTGAKVLVENGFKSLEGKNVGLITNYTAMVDNQHIADLMNEAPNVNLIALFGPEHGIRGDDNTGFQTDKSTGLPVHSLYGEHRKPTAAMLKDIDVLVFDIQDIGPRFYTYISTMGLAMEAAAENNISFLVLDRPNPLGGEVASGFVLEPEFKSFIGYFPIPVTHGLTVGELAIMAKKEGTLEGVDNLDLSVIKMEGWHRDMLWPDTGLTFVGPSPNMPDFSTALIYPGACFWEAVKGSEGRGTPLPFMQLVTLWANSDS